MAFCYANNMDNTYWRCSSFGSSGSSKIPIAIINSDKGIYGDIYEDVMKNEKT